MVGAIGLSRALGAGGAEAQDDQAAIDQGDRKGTHGIEEVARLREAGPMLVALRLVADLLAILRRTLIKEHEGVLVLRLGMVPP